MVVISSLDVNYMNRYVIAQEVYFPYYILPTLPKFEPVSPAPMTSGVIIQRRSSVIKEVPRHQSAEGDAKAESTHQDLAHLLSEESNTSECKNTRPRRKRRAKAASKTGNEDSDEDWTMEDKKRHKCPHCSMRFKKPSALVIHMRTHSGERPYTCKQCSKRFSISGNLRRHMFTHTGEKPYKCSACGRAFNNPSHLARHSKKIHI